MSNPKAENTIKKETKWLFVKVSKSRIVKTTDAYTIIKVGQAGFTAVIGNVFRRKKEHEDCVFFSIPEDFITKSRLSVYVKEEKRYDTIDEELLSAWQLVNLINEDNKLIPHAPSPEEVEEMVKPSK